MRILHLLGDRKLPADPNKEGTSGVVRAALEMARAQIQLGHEVSIAVVGHRPWRSMWNGVQLVGLSSTPWARIYRKGRVLDFSQHIPYILFTRRHDFDIVHGHLYTYLRFLRAKGHVAHFHSDPFYKGRKNEAIDLKLVDFAHIARNSDVQIAVSQFIAQELERGFHSLGNVHLVQHGVDAVQFDYGRWREASLRLRHEWQVPQNGVVFLFAGAIVPEKGVIHLARAFARLADQHSNVHLALAGTSSLWGSELAANTPGDSYEDQVSDVLRGCVEAGRVHFLGKVASSRMPIVYAASDILVIPSLWREAFGLVALEALATGCPVIASSVGGLVEFVNEENGIFVPPGEEPALEDAMRNLAENPDLRKKLGRAARSQAQRFSWEITAQQLDVIYRVLLANKA